jgi:hypothetical protein
MQKHFFCGIKIENFDEKSAFEHFCSGRSKFAVKGLKNQKFFWTDLKMFSGPYKNSKVIVGFDFCRQKMFSIMI